MMLRRWIARCGREKFSIYYLSRIPGIVGPKVDLSTKENATLAAAAPELLAECIAALASLKLASVEISKLGATPGFGEQIDRLERLIESLRPGR